MGRGAWWAMKKAERRRIDAFELWCWRRLLRVPWTARRSNQSILKEISPGCSFEDKDAVVLMETRSYICKGERSREGIVREFGMDTYTLLYLKWITNKDQL